MCFQTCNGHRLLTNLTFGGQVGAKSDHVGGWCRDSGCVLGASGRLVSGENVARGAIGTAALPRPSVEFAPIGRVWSTKLPRTDSHCGALNAIGCRFESSTRAVRLSRQSMEGSPVLEPCDVRACCHSGCQRFRRGRYDFRSSSQSYVHTMVQPMPLRANG